MFIPPVSRANALDMYSVLCQCTQFRSYFQCEIRYRLVNHGARLFTLSQSKFSFPNLICHIWRPQFEHALANQRSHPPCQTTRQSSLRRLATRPWRHHGLQAGRKHSPGLNLNQFDPQSSRTLSGVLFFCGGAVITAVPCGG